MRTLFILLFVVEVLSREGDAKQVSSPSSVKFYKNKSCKSDRARQPGQFGFVSSVLLSQFGTHVPPWKMAAQRRHVRLPRILTKLRRIGNGTGRIRADVGRQVKGIEKIVKGTSRSSAFH